MPQFKGLVLHNARDFCVDRFGRDGWERVLASLDARERETAESAVHVGWYDIRLYDHLHDAIVEVLGDGRHDVMTALGKWSAERDLTTVQRLFLRLATPTFMLQKYGDYWKRYQDSGEWTVVREDERRIRGTLSKWASQSEAACVRLAGYIGRMMELIGAKGIRVTRVRCRSRGDAACEYLLEWTSGSSTPIS